MGDIMKNKKGGYILDSNDNVIADTHQCCHCNKHWVAEPGSGKIRGYCPKCDALTCGDIKCCECVPFEKKLDQYEKGTITQL